MEWSRAGTLPPDPAQESCESEGLPDAEAWEGGFLLREPAVVPRPLVSLGRARSAAHFGGRRGYRCCFILYVLSEQMSEGDKEIKGRETERAFPQETVRVKAQKLLR